jgi:hypothetical protein
MQPETDSQPQQQRAGQVDEQSAGREKAGGAMLHDLVDQVARDGTNAGRERYGESEHQRPSSSLLRPT